MNLAIVIVINLLGVAVFVGIAAFVGWANDAYADGKIDGKRNDTSHDWHEGLGLVFYNMGFRKENIKARREEVRKAYARERNEWIDDSAS